jgi:hypothetical protein
MPAKMLRFQRAASSLKADPRCQGVDWRLYASPRIGEPLQLPAEQVREAQAMLESIDREMRQTMTAEDCKGHWTAANVLPAVALLL